MSYSLWLGVDWPVLLPYTGNGIPLGMKVMLNCNPVLKGKLGRSCGCWNKAGFIMQIPMNSNTEFRVSSNVTYWHLCSWMSQLFQHGVCLTRFFCGHNRPRSSQVQYYHLFGKLAPQPVPCLQESQTSDNSARPHVSHPDWRPSDIIDWCRSAR